MTGRVLVTGAAGFICSTLTERLLKNGHVVVRLDNFTSFYPRRQKERKLSACQLHPNFTFVEGRLEALGSWEQHNNPHFAAIFHLAARAEVRPSVANPLSHYQTNVIGTAQVLEFAKNQGIKRVFLPLPPASTETLPPATSTKITPTCSRSASMRQRNSLERMSGMYTVSCTI